MNRNIVRFQNQATGKFLDSNEFGDVYAYEENDGNYQKWHIENVKNGLRLRNVATSRYLDNYFFSEVHTSSFVSIGLYQTWYFDGLRIINYSTGKALDSNNEGKVYTLNPNFGNNQNWIQK